VIGFAIVMRRQFIYNNFLGYHGNVMKSIGYLEGA